MQQLEHSKKPPKMFLPSPQRTSSFFNSCGRETGGVCVRYLSNPLSGYGSLELVSQYENVAVENEILFKQRWELLFAQDQQTQSKGLRVGFFEM